VYVRYLLLTSACFLSDRPLSYFFPFWPPLSLSPPSAPPSTKGPSSRPTLRSTDNLFPLPGRRYRPWSEDASRPRGVGGHIRRKLNLDFLTRWRPNAQRPVGRITMPRKEAEGEGAGEEYIRQHGGREGVMAEFERLTRHTRRDGRGSGVGV